MNDKQPNTPKEGRGDWVHGLVKGGIGLVPGVGSVVAEVFGLVLAPPVARRRDEWMEDVAKRLKQVEEREHIPLEEMARNETFIDTVLQATQSALRTQSALKRAALKNAIVNSLKPLAPDAASQHMFLSFVDRFTDWHIQLLDLFHGPLGWAVRHGTRFPELMMGPPSHLLESAFPELAQQKEFYRQVWRDLHAAGLVDGDSLAGTMTWNGIISKRTTSFGDKFLSFISE